MVMATKTISCIRCLQTYSSRQTSSYDFAPQNRNPISTTPRVWLLIVPREPKPNPGVMLVAFTNERSPRVKNFWYWYVGVAVSDQAALPGPYSMLKEFEAAPPELEMYSKRPAIDHPFLRVRLAKIAPPQADAPCGTPMVGLVGTSLY